MISCLLLSAGFSQTLVMIYLIWVGVYVVELVGVGRLLLTSMPTKQLGSFLSTPGPFIGFKISGIPPFSCIGIM